MEQKKLEGLPFHNNKNSMTSIIMTNIKDEAKHWIIAGAKHLTYLIPGEKQWLGLHKS
jgi:hypothetical protein